MHGVTLRQRVRLRCIICASTIYTRRSLASIGATPYWGTGVGSSNLPAPTNNIKDLFHTSDFLSSPYPTLVAQILKISSAYSPPPPEGFISPMTWGVKNNVIERFASAGVPKEKISFVRDTYTFNFPGTPSEFVAAFKTFYGPTMNAFEAAEKNGRAGDLQKELEALFNSQNKSTSKAVTSILATFLRVTVSP